MYILLIAEMLEDGYDPNLIAPDKLFSGQTASKKRAKARKIKKHQQGMCSRARSVPTVTQGEGPCL